MESNVDSINKDVDLFKLRMNDMPLHGAPLWDSHEVGLPLGSSWWGTMATYESKLVD
jgi:hypothetical protein